MAAVGSWAASRAGASTGPNASHNNGTRVQLWDCNGQSNQSWTCTAGTQLTVYGNMRLDVWSTADGQQVQLRDSGQANQQFRPSSSWPCTVSSLSRPGRALGPGVATSRDT